MRKRIVAMKLGLGFSYYLLAGSIALLSPPLHAESGAGHDTPAGAGHRAHWAYDGQEGPAAWGRLTADYARCATGQEQSPIDIRHANTATLPLIGTHYPASGLNIINNGHTIQVNHGAGGAAMLGGQRYRLAQFHFHAPSEHRIDGQSYPMEAHLVHQDEHGKLAVIGVLFKEGAAHPFLDKFWARLPGAAGPARTASDVSLNTADLLPGDKSYYHYPGSLTTPPCSEGVSWYVLKTPIEASGEQIRQFAALFGHNERPMQPLNGREVALVEDTGEFVAVPAAMTVPGEDDQHGLGREQSALAGQK